MKLFSTGRPSPALLVAVAALVFAMAGSALAGSDAASRAITKSKVKSISKKQADKELKANVSGSHVNQADTATTATNATNATNAGNASQVDGNSVTKIFDKFPDGTTNRTIATFGGAYTLKADCTGGDVENLIITSSDPAVAMTATGDGNTGVTFDEEQGGVSNVTLNLDDNDGAAPDNDRGQVQFSLAKTGGDAVSGVLGFDDPNLFNGEAVCAVYGTISLNG